MNRILLCLLSCAFVASAQPKPDLSGVWEFDKVKSPPAPKLKRMTFKIAQDASTFSVATQYLSSGSVQDNAATYKIGGSSTGTMHGGPMTSNAAWDGQTLVVKSVVKLNQDLVLTDYWSLSPDGKTITFREVSKFGTSPEEDTTRFYSKQPEATWDPQAFDKPAEQIFQNIQSLKGVPAKRLGGVMNNFTRWLGVDCAYCHELSAYEKDDKAPKQTTRRMFTMVRKINQESNFSGPPNPVTCWTCHRGEAKPQSLPAPAKPAQ